jgi:hypothetical protein
MALRPHRAKRGLSDIIMQLAPSFSRGAAAFALVAAPGRVLYPALSGYGQQREFIFCPGATQEYDHHVAQLIDPAGGRFHAGTVRNVGLMPMNVYDTAYPGDPGGDPDMYYQVAENYLNVS